jgi:hypothetical protein
MKPLLNKLSPPPNKYDADYYSKLDLYLKNLYEFTQQINDVVTWIELKAQENEQRDAKLAAAVKDVEQQLDDTAKKVKCDLDGVVKHLIAESHCLSSKNKHDNEVMNKQLDAKINDRLTRYDNVISLLISENAKATQALNEATRQQFEQQAENKRVLDEVVKLRAVVNFKGSWSALSGTANVPFVVYHKDKYWNLVRAVRRVEAQEPSFSDVWVEV